MAHPSGAAGSLLESCGNATHSAQAVDDVAAAGTALRRRGLQLPPLVVSDLPQLIDGDWDQLLASHDGVHTSSVDGWFARVRSTAAECWGPTRALHFLRRPRTPSHAHTLLSASPVDSSRLAPSTRRASASSPARGALPCRVGLTCWHMCCTDALPAAPRCQRAFRQKADEMKTTAGSDAQGTDQGCSAGPGASSPGPVSPVSPDQVACPPPRSISRLALDEDGGRSSMDDDSGQSSPSADGRSSRRRGRGRGRPAACPPPPAAAPSAATEEQLKGLFGRSHMLAHSPHLAMLAMSIVPPESPDQDAQ